MYFIICVFLEAKWKHDDLAAYRHHMDEPLDTMDEIRRAVNFALSYDVTGLCTASDTRILPMIIKACDHFIQLSNTELAEMIQSAKQYEPLFV